MQYPAAAALAFYPIGVSANASIVGAGQWYLPTLGEWMDVYGYDYSNISDCGGKIGAHGKTIKIINETLTTLKSKTVAAEVLTPNGFYWSSLENGFNAAWRLYLGTDLDFLHSRAKTEPSRVRVSLEF